MILEKKLELALKSNDRTVIECVFNEIYHEYYKLIYFFKTEVHKKINFVSVLFLDVLLVLFLRHC